jgi:hypothetical protein
MADTVDDANTVDPGTQAMPASPSTPVDQAQQIQALMLQVQQLQQQLAQKAQIPSSASSATVAQEGPTTKQKLDNMESWQKELADLPINWGDMDPMFVEQLRHSPDARKALVELHAPKEVQELDGIKLTKRKAVVLSDATALNLSAETTEDIKKMFSFYHEQCILPNFDSIRKACVESYSQLSANIDTLAFRHSFLGRQVQSLEKLHSRCTLILKGVPSLVTLPEIDSNISTLCYVTGQDYRTVVQDKYNYAQDEHSSVLFVRFVTESQCSQVKQWLRSHSFYWKSKYQNDVKIKWETHISTDERLAIQPVYAAMTMLTGKGTQLEGQPLTLDKNSLQVIYESDTGPQLLFQLCFLIEMTDTGSYSYKARAYFRQEDEHLVISSYPIALMAKLREAMHMIQIEHMAIQQGTMRRGAHWQIGLDTLRNANIADLYPFRLEVVFLDAAIGPMLLEDPLLPVQCNLGVFKTYQALFQGSQTPMSIDEDNGRQRRPQPYNRYLPSFLARQIDDTPNKGKGKASGKSKDSSKGKQKGKSSSQYTPARKEDWWRQDDYNPDGSGSSGGNRWHSSGGSQSSWNAGYQSNQGGSQKWEDSKEQDKKNWQYSDITPSDPASNLDLQVRAQIRYCSTCKLPLGLTVDCQECSNNRWMYCEYVLDNGVDKSHRLGTAPHCSLCKDHVKWLRKTLGDEKARIQVNKLPYLVAKDLSLFKALSDWHPLRGQIAQSVIQEADALLQDVRINYNRYESYNCPTDRIQDSLQLLRDSLQVTPDPCLSFYKYRTWTCTDLQKLYNESDDNVAYFIYSVHKLYPSSLALAIFLLLSKLWSKQIVSPAYPKFVVQADLKLTLDTWLLPWPHFIQFAFLQLAISNGWKKWDVTPGTMTALHIEQLLNNEFGTNLSLEQWVESFSSWLNACPEYAVVFHGIEQFTAQNLKTYAHIGSLLFDTMTATFAQLYGLQYGQNKDGSPECAANQALGAMYDEVLKAAYIDTSPNSGNRSLNNRGNSMEALAFCLLQSHAFSLLFFTQYICFHYQYQGTSYPFVRNIC